MKKPPPRQQSRDGLQKRLANLTNAGKGRPLGVPNKATAEVKAAAVVYTAEAVDTLARIMRDPEMPPQARVAACRELLDRGHGKPSQAVEVGNPDGSPVVFQVITNVPDHAD